MSTRRTQQSSCPADPSFSGSGAPRSSTLSANDNADNLSVGAADSRVKCSKVPNRSVLAAPGLTDRERECLTAGEHTDKTKGGTLQN